MDEKKPKRTQVTITLHPDTARIIGEVGRAMSERLGTMTTPSIGNIVDMLAMLAEMHHKDTPSEYDTIDLTDEARLYADKLVKYGFLRVLDEYPEGDEGDMGFEHPPGYTYTFEVNPCASRKEMFAHTERMVAEHAKRQHSDAEAS